MLLSLEKLITRLKCNVANFDILPYTPRPPPFQREKQITHPHPLTLKLSKSLHISKGLSADLVIVTQTQTHRPYFVSAAERHQTDVYLVFHFN